MYSEDSHDSFLEYRKQEIKDEGISAPLAFSKLEEKARDQLKSEVFGFAATGAGLEMTKQANRDGFSRWEILPRVLRDVSQRDLRTQLFGRELPAPVLLAPIGGQSVFDNRGEIASAQAAASIGLPMVLSTVASRSLETIAENLGETPRALQLYWMQDRDVTASLVHRAERAGYNAIMLTVDSQISAWRLRNLENRYSSSQDAERANLLTDPVVKERLSEHSDGDAETSVHSLPNVSKDSTLTWEDIGWLREQTSLSIFLKGILHPEDAKTAIECGFDGIVVSNHGGRQIDGERGAVDALPDVVTAVNGELPVLLDSGVRSGADIFKALALGADAVLVGRPYAYGLAIAGEQGVYEVLMNYLAELESVMGLSGYPTIESIDSTAVVRKAKSAEKGNQHH